MTNMNVLALSFKYLQKPIKLASDPIFSLFYIKYSLQ